MKHSSLVSVVLPVFAEGRSILRFHADLERVLEPLRSAHSFEFLYVVDPAGDETEAVLKDLCAASADVSLIVMSRRFGHQAALLAGIDNARGDAVLMMDSDGQHPVELIPDIIAAWGGGAQIVQMVRGENKNTTWFKRLTSRTFYKLFQRVAGIDIPPGAADFRLIDRSVRDVFRDQLRERRIFLRGMMMWVGFRMHLIPYQPKARQFGATKYRLSTLVDLGFMGFVNFTNLPLRLMVYGGVALAIASALSLIVLLGMYFSGAARNVPGWTSIMFLLGMASGMQFLFLGILGEYVSQVLDEVKGRPRYLIADRRGAIAKGRQVNES